ncbi:4Fe-4S dicluster domain-containing protein [bacterium]|nr:4Fe-4S dicluster domain-containing protein [bacterium]
MADTKPPWGVVQWGMVVDADRCTGCKACVVACRSENNIATVGAEASAMGRMMDWIRIERMFHGEYPDIQTMFVPMLCQHCGSAPCESVCPVFAAVGTHDGLNAQIYNRCVGTRLCANNCPYHVRMYNFVQPKWPPSMELLLNPDVSVRNEGVMEKCTMCVQRIRRADLDVKVSKRPYADGELRTACVQSCPSGALVFGDLNDEESTISKLVKHESNRTYYIGHVEYHTAPNVIYLRPEKNAEALGE